MVQEYSRPLSVYYFGKPQLWQGYLLSLSGSHPRVHGTCSTSSPTLKSLPPNCPYSVELILLRLFQRNRACVFQPAYLFFISLSDIHNTYRQTWKHIPTSRTYLPNIHRGRILHADIETHFHMVRSPKSCNTHSDCITSVRPL